MSVAIAPLLPHELAAVDDGTETPQAGLPPTLTDAQGRVFKLGTDPATGAPQYRHASAQRDQAGSTLALEILITIAADGSFTRRTTQQLALVNGDSQREVVLASHAADGTQVGETVESSSREGSATTSERTVGSYAAGKLIRRETHIDQRDEATDAKTREHTVVSTKIQGTWYNDDKPIAADTVPFVARDETQEIRSPGLGINKDTDRTLTFTRHGEGPLNAIDWDDAGMLLVRFDGRRGQYIERELRVPLDQATGAPQMGQAEVTRTDDRQNLVNKGLMQARIWGGLASNLSWIVGLNFARGGAMKGMLAFSAAASGAQLLGEGHAVATKRNDGDWGRVAMSAYDMVLTGLLAAYVGNRSDARSQLTGPQLLGANALGASALAMNGAELSGAINSIGVDALTDRLDVAGIGVDLLRRSTGPSSPLDGDWRLVPRFDAARTLLG